MFKDEIIKKLESYGLNVENMQLETEQGIVETQTPMIVAQDNSFWVPNSEAEVETFIDMWDNDYGSTDIESLRGTLVNAAIKSAEYETARNESPDRWGLTTDEAVEEALSDFDDLGNMDELQAQKAELAEAFKTQTLQEILQPQIDYFNSIGKSEISQELESIATKYGDAKEEASKLVRASEEATKAAENTEQALNDIDEITGNKSERELYIVQDAKKIFNSTKEQAQKIGDSLTATGVNIASKTKSLAERCKNDVKLSSLCNKEKLRRLLAPDLAKLENKAQILEQNKAKLEQEIIKLSMVQKSAERNLDTLGQKFQRSSNELENAENNWMSRKEWREDYINKNADKFASPAALKAESRARSKIAFENQEKRIEGLEDKVDIAEEKYNAQADKLDAITAKLAAAKESLEAVNKDLGHVQGIIETEKGHRSEFSKKAEEIIKKAGVNIKDNKVAQAQKLMQETR